MSSSAVLLTYVTVTEIATRFAMKHGSSRTSPPSGRLAHPVLCVTYIAPRLTFVTISHPHTRTIPFC